MTSVKNTDESTLGTSPTASGVLSRGDGRAPGGASGGSGNGVGGSPDSFSVIERGVAHHSSSGLFVHTGDDADADASTVNTEGTDYTVTMDKGVGEKVLLSDGVHCRALFTDHRSGVVKGCGQPIRAGKCVRGHVSDGDIPKVPAGVYDPKGKRGGHFDVDPESHMTLADHAVYEENLKEKVSAEYATAGKTPPKPKMVSATPRMSKGEPAKDHEGFSFENPKQSPAASLKLEPLKFQMNLNEMENLLAAFKAQQTELDQERVLVQEELRQADEEKRNYRNQATRFSTLSSQLEVTQQKLKSEKEALEKERKLLDERLEQLAKAQRKTTDPPKSALKNSSSDEHHTLPKSGTKTRFYAVAEGRIPGIYNTWQKAKEQTEGFSGALHQRFSSREEAQDWLDDQEYERSQALHQQERQHRRNRQESRSASRDRMKQAQEERRRKDQESWNHEDNSYSDGAGGGDLSGGYGSSSDSSRDGHSYDHHQSSNNRKGRKKRTDKKANRGRNRGGRNSTGSTSESPERPAGIVVTDLPLFTADQSAGKKKEAYGTKLEVKDKVLQMLCPEGLAKDTQRDLIEACPDGPSLPGTYNDREVSDQANSFAHAISQLQED
jgi:viroplasmin and RNaseH domain-containing protein